MPYVFGLDLNKIRFSAFKSSNMFDGRSYLRSQRFIFYQLAMIVTVCAESTATYAMTKYLDLQEAAQRMNPESYVWNNDIVGAVSLTIFAGVFTAIVYGCLFFFLLFWPDSRETPFWALVKKISATFCTLVVLAAAIWSTVVVATHSAYISGLTPTQYAALRNQLRVPLKYSDYPHNLAYVIMLWIGWVFCVISNVYVFIASAYHIKHDSETSSGTEKGLREPQAASGDY